MEQTENQSTNFQSATERQKMKRPDMHSKEESWKRPSSSLVVVNVLPYTITTPLILKLAEVAQNEHL